MALLNNTLAMAGAAPTTPCDPNYMNAIEARAYLEAEREVMQNANLITKPDSVLEYTCFDQYIGWLGDDNSWTAQPDAAPFSDSTRWGIIPDQGHGVLGKELNQVVANVAEDYIANNFDNNYLGGRETNHYKLKNPAPQNYNCNEMDQVWLEAQCLDFFDIPGQDAFFDFPWYKTNDPRKKPGPACTVPATIGTSIPVAFNGHQAQYTLATENSWPTTANPVAYNEDAVVTHFDLIMPNGTTVGTGTTVSCANVVPIPTGVCVVRAGWSQVYQDAVCPNPGCHYKAPGNTANSQPDPTTCPGTAPKAGDCAD